MGRTTLAILFFSSLLAAPLGVSAEDLGDVKECVASGTVVSITIGMSVVAPHEDLAHAESRDPLLSLGAEAREARGAATIQREVEQKTGIVLWCMNPDDPRCSPVDGSSDASLSQALLRYGAPEMPTVAAPAANGVTFPPHESRAHVGTRSRVERPPRA